MDTCTYENDPPNEDSSRVSVGAVGEDNASTSEFTCEYIMPKTGGLVDAPAMFDIE